MVTRIDLRVHTTAPSSKKDDDRFKAQAEAYASFVTTRKITTIPNHGSLATQDASPRLRHLDTIPTNIISKVRMTPEQQADKSLDMIYDPTTFLEETQLGYTALESQLFAPSSRVPTSLPRQSIRPVEASTPEVSRSGSGSSVLDGSRQNGRSSSSREVPSQSSYLKSPVLDRSRKKPRINYENRHLFPTKKSLLTPVIPSRENASHATGRASNGPENASIPIQDSHHAFNLADNSMSVDDVTSELPTSYSLSDRTSVSSKSRQYSIQRSVSDPGLPVPEAPEPVLVRQDDASPQRPEPPSRDVVQVPEPSAPVAATPCPASPKHSSGNIVVKDFANVKAAHQETPGRHAGPESLSELPTSIRPPAPQPSLQRFESHITESLRYLGDNVNLAQCYKPVFVSRELRQSERGYWTLDITPWPAQLRVEFFQFLAKMIEPGRVGWGVWCVREPTAFEVRLFCWGEVVRHVYLMLYVASKSKVRKLGLKWIDAEGETVVQMRGADSNNRVETV